MLLSGKEVARSVYDAIAKDYVKHKHRACPKLVIIQVGDNAASSVYVRNKIRAVSAMGFVAEHQVFAATASSAEIRDFIQRCNTDPTVHGILLQLPLPAALKPQTYALVESIAAEKDVDGLTTKSLGQLVAMHCIMKIISRVRLWLWLNCLNTQIYLYKVAMPLLLVLLIL